MILTEYVVEVGYLGFLAVGYTLLMDITRALLFKRVEVKETVESKIKEVVSSIREVKAIYKLRILETQSGRIISFHIEVDPRMTIECAHKLIEEIERRIISEISNTISVTVHIEPHHKPGEARLIEDEEFLKVIRRAIERYREVRKVNRVIACENIDRISIYIDCIVNGRTPVEEIHKLTIEMEHEIRNILGKKVEIDIHTEPE